MLSYKEELEQAIIYHRQCEEGMKNTPEPEGQKYPIGTRVFIPSDLGGGRKHFHSELHPVGVYAKVAYTYSHRFGNGGPYGVKSYCVQIDGVKGLSSWYSEENLTEVKD